MTVSRGLLIVTINLIICIFILAYQIHTLANRCDVIEKQAEQNLYLLDRQSDYVRHTLEDELRIHLSQIQILQNRVNNESKAN